MVVGEGVCVVRTRSRMMRYGPAYWDSNRIGCLFETRARRVLVGVLSHCLLPNLLGGIQRPVRLLHARRGERGEAGVVWRGGESNIERWHLGKDENCQGG
ncbi:hypothetical protein BDR07DRAFT_1420518 [Suillus spraguei]|nr:hypothetical protein BDR07DRAFT_1420518 [Suillus spraguei]